jgi:small GTP-binding protein
MAKSKALRAAEKKIAEALRTGAAELDLSCGHSAKVSDKLTELPRSLSQLTQLQSLDLSGNQLTSLPEWLGQLTQLRSLSLSRNQLGSLPDCLGQLTQLQSLELSLNQLKSLPESLGQLAQLQSLDLSFNQLESLPESLGQLAELQSLRLPDNHLRALPECLGQLSQLRSLNLSNNHLEALPECLGQLSELRSLDLSDNHLKALPECLGRLSKLQSLNLCYSRLTALPESLGLLTQLQSLDLTANYCKLTELTELLGQLTQLSELHISGIPLGKLPESVARLTKLTTLSAAAAELDSVPEWLGDLSSLQELCIGNISDHSNVVSTWDHGNRLRTLPDSIGRLRNLRVLDLSHNRLTALPESLGRCQRLEHLALHGNKALGIPPEILGPKTRSRYRRDANDALAILDWYFRSRNEPTRRLNEAKMLLVGQGGVGKTSLVHYLIHNRPCDPSELPTEGINIDDWQVQGRKGEDGRFDRINLHVWDFGGQEIMHATHQFFLTRRSLYVLVIDARAGEKESNIHYWLKIIQSYGSDSPVLVVVNKCDQHPHELNETRLMRDYPNIRAVIQTSCADGQGVAELRREIGKHVRRLPHVFDELPTSYFAVKAELEQVAAEKHYIPIEDYRKICVQHVVEERESQDRLIRFLHDLGVVLNFQDPDDPYCQNDPFVLNPEWVTGGVYAIVNDRGLKAKRDGLLTREKLRDVLNALGSYPANRHDFIVRKMMQFELAYQIGQGRDTCWLIPELLDPKEPDQLQWKPGASLNFQYSYPVLPAGVVCRLIVRMQQHVDRKRSWRSGTVLTIDGATILIRGDMEKNKAFIAVQGPVKQRKDCLAIVRDAFRHVHSTIPALRPAEEVPLPDKPAVSVPYDHLLKLEESGEVAYFPVGADRRYSVTELLNGVDSTQYQIERRKRMQKERTGMSEKHVFVSYCHDNKDEVARLVEYLQSAGESVWWDENILGGRDWKEAIREAMKNAYAVVVCVSPELTEERYRSGVYPELRDAIATLRQYAPKHSYILPVRLEECEVPPIEIDDTRTLERIQHIDLFPESKRGAGLTKLLESLAATPGHR